jgi:hypothetical protein
VRKVAWHFDWELYDIGDASADTYVDVWFSSDRSTEIHYVENQFVGLEYITLRGEGTADVQQQIKSRCSIWTTRDALTAYRESEDRNEKLRAVYAAALSATTQDNPGLIHAFRVIAQEEADAGIRQALTVATGYLPLPELIEVVERLRISDPEQHVRNNARIMLEGVRLNRSESEDGK